MKKKRIKKLNEIIKVKTHIEKVCPRAEEIEVRVEKDRDGSFVSRIKVHLPSRKFLLAEKKSEAYGKALDQSYQAILRQLHKVKTRWDKTKTRRSMDVLNFGL